MDRDRRWNTQNVAAVCTVIAAIFIAAFICLLIGYAVARGQDVDPNEQPKIALKQAALDSCNRDENTATRALCIAVVNMQNTGK